MSKTVKILYTIAVLTGLMAILAFLYPVIGDAWNRYISSRLITEYREIPRNSKNDRRDEEVLERARNYNRELAADGDHQIDRYTLKLSGNTAQDTELAGQVVHPDRRYESELSVSENGVMGYVTIPAIDVSLPIYHYTSEEVLGKGVGHLYGSSLPVGGKNTHAVLVGHSGLMTARLFSDLEKMRKGEQFTVHVLGKQLTYQVDQIRKVLPYETDDLAIERDKDLVTLMTCTPYGVNTHRLLVRGHRIKNGSSKQNTNIVHRSITHFPILIFIGCITLIVIAIFLIKRIWTGTFLKKRTTK